MCWRWTTAAASSWSRPIRQPAPIGWCRRKERAMAGRWKPPIEAATENAAPEPEIMPALPEEGGTVSMPEAVEDEAPPLDVPGDLTPWGIFLASLSAETRELVPEEELRASFEAVGKKARDARRQQLKAAAVAKAEAQARHLAGLTTAEQMAAEALAER